MAMELIIASGIIGIISIYMFFKFSESTGNEHFIYQLLLLGLTISTVVVLGGVGIHESTCDFVPINSTANLDVVTYEYDTICREPTELENTYYKLTQWFYRLSMTYIVFYVIYKILMALGYDLLKRFKR